MKGFRNVLDFYITSSIHLSIAIVSLAVITFWNFSVPLDQGLLLFIFLASITGYNFIKYAGIAKLHHLSLAKNIRVIQIFSLFVFIGLIFSYFYQSLKVLMIAFMMGIFTLLYALPIFNGGRNLRGIPGIKIYVIAWVVSVVTVLMPLVERVNILQWDVIVDFLQRFLIVIALLLPFEIRDLKYDMAQLDTIPQNLGVPGTKLLGYLLISSFILLEFLKRDPYLPYVLSLLLFGLLVLWSINKASIRQGKYYASFWVEGIPIAWGIIFWILLKIN